MHFVLPLWSLPLNSWRTKTAPWLSCTAICQAYVLLLSWEQGVLQMACLDLNYAFRTTSASFLLAPTLGAISNEQDSAWKIKLGFQQRQLGSPFTFPLTLFLDILLQGTLGHRSTISQFAKSDCSLCLEQTEISFRFSSSLSLICIQCLIAFCISIRSLFGAT